LFLLFFTKILQKIIQVDAPHSDVRFRSRRSTTMKTNFLTKLFSIAFLTLISHTAEAGRGCCSWHGGVSHCDSSVGRLVCADFTYSPSCSCEIKYKQSSRNRRSSLRRVFRLHLQQMHKKRYQRHYKQGHIYNRASPLQSLIRSPSKFTQDNHNSQLHKKTALYPA
jgi:hypothetical protein